jgi:hypothetical protein
MYASIEMHKLLSLHAQRSLCGELFEFWDEMEEYKVLWHRNKKLKRREKIKAAASMSNRNTPRGNQNDSDNSNAVTAIDSSTNNTGQMSMSLPMSSADTAVDIVNPKHIPVDKTAFAIYVYNKYIKIDSPFELNISDALRRDYRTW